MSYAKVENNVVTEYPVFYGDILRRFPNTSFPIPFEAPDGYEPVISTPQPSVNYDKNLKEGTPEWINGVLTQVWILENATEQEIAQRTEFKAHEVRSTRNGLLTECDWTQLADSSADSEAWATYRQALRDIPEQVGFPWEVTWPTKP